MNRIPQLLLNNQPGSILSPCLRRARLHSWQRQRVLSLLDKSGSMNEENKLQSALKANYELGLTLAQPNNQNAFEMAVIWYSNIARVSHPFAPVSSFLNRFDNSFDDGFTGETNITSALEQAHQILKAQRPTSEKHVYARPVCVLMSDGRHNCGPDPFPAANALKEISDLITIAFGDCADEQTLRAIATTEQLCVRCRTGADLRCYFAQVGQTLTVTRAAGSNAVLALATLSS